MKPLFAALDVLAALDVVAATTAPAASPPPATKLDRRAPLLQMPIWYNPDWFPVHREIGRTRT